MHRSNFKTLGYILPVFIMLSFILSGQNVIAQLAGSEITAGNDFGVGARAMGMGGAFMSVADDYTALYWNPAGLSQLKKLEAYTSLSYEKLNTNTEYFGDSDSTFSSNTRINALGMVIPVPVYQGGLAFAFGVNRVQSFDSRVRFRGFNDLTIEEDYEFGQLFIDELHDESGGLFSWSFGGAVEVLPGVSLGGNISFLSGDYDYERNLDADDTEELDSELTGFSYRDAISSDYFGVDSKIGLLASPVQQVRLGLTIDVPLDFSVDEYWREDSFYSYDDGTSESIYDPEGADWNSFPYDISRPFRFSGGVAFYPIPEAVIAADLTYTDWTQMEYSEPPAEDLSNEDFKEYYRATTRFHAGGEFTIPSAGMRLRAGYVFDPKPYAPETIIVESERQFLTFGLGMMIGEALFLDLAFVRGMWKDNTSDGVINRDSATNRIFLSCGYRF